MSPARTLPAGRAILISWAGNGRVRISVPAGASRPLIKVFHDGREIIEQQTWTIDEPIPGTGQYRAEVFLRQPGLTGWRRWTLWAFTNPVYVTEPAGAAAAKFHGALVFDACFPRI